MYNSRYRQSASDPYEQRKMRFSSYQDLSHLLKRKPSAHSYSRSTQKQSPLEYTNHLTQQILPKSSLNLNRNDIRLSTHANPQFFKETQKEFYRSKPQSRVSLAFQSQNRSSIKRPMSAYRNTSLKIADLSSTLDILQNQIRSARQQINIALNDKTKLSESMQNQLKKLRDFQCKEINGLAKKFKVKKEIDLQRKQQIRTDVNNLWYSNENLKQNLFQMQQRVQKLEIQMGNHEHL